MRLSDTLMDEETLIDEGIYEMCQVCTNVPAIQKVWCHDHKCHHFYCSICFERKYTQFKDLVERGPDDPPFKYIGGKRRHRTRLVGKAIKATSL